MSLTPRPPSDSPIRPEDRRDIETVRAYVEGTLSPAERAEVDGRAARDPDLAALLSAYAEIHSATQDPADAVPALSLAFEDLRLDDAPPAPVLSMRRVPRVAIAAAAVLALGVGVYLFARGDGAERSAPPALALAAIPLDAATVPEAPEIPAALADYAPVDAKGLHFLQDFDAAKALSKFVGRPMVVFVYHPQCPWCIEYGKKQFVTDDVKQVAAQVVLVKLNVMTLDDRLDIPKPDDVGWPIFAAFDASGARKAAFGGYMKDGKDMATALAKAIAATQAKATLDWEKARTLAKALRDADAEGAAPAAAFGAWTTTAAADPSGPLGAVARSRLVEKAQAARTDLFAARDAAANGGAGRSLALVDGAMPKYRGTPYEADFAAVRDRLARGEPFPVLETKR